jgi:hypothetical protein
MHEVVKNANQVQSKPVVVCDYNVNMLGVDLNDQMLQLYLLERKKSTKWYLKLFKRLLNVAIHNAMVIISVSPRQQKYGHTKVQTLISTRPRGKTRFSCSSSCIGAAIRHLSRYLRDSQSNISWSIFPPEERRQNLKKDE